MGEYADDALDFEMSRYCSYLDGEYDDDPDYAETFEDRIQKAIRKFFVPGQQCKCGGKFVLKTNTKTGDKFVGCDKFPTCRLSSDLGSDLN